MILSDFLISCCYTFIMMFALYANCREWAKAGLGRKRAGAVFGLLTYTMIYAFFWAEQPLTTSSILIISFGPASACIIVLSIFFDKPHLKMK